MTNREVRYHKRKNRCCGHHSHMITSAICQFSHTSEREFFDLLKMNVTIAPAPDRIPELEKSITIYTNKPNK